jgi:quercetin dioxygenase-like cupin family protein
MNRVNVFAGVSAAVVSVACVAVAGQAGATAGSRLAFSHSLPALRGDRLQTKVVEVTYGPGESSAAHRHPCPVVGYVLEGSIRSKVGSGPETVYKTGEAFFEDTNALHAVSANASTTTRARLLAVFTCDTDAPLVTPERRAAP